MAKAHKPRLAVWKFASCDGCQLSLLDCEDELLAVAGAIDIAYFLEATRGPDRRAATTCRWSKARSPRPHDAERIREVRRHSDVVITIGACATAGGIQALRNFADVKEYHRDRLCPARLHLDAGDLDGDRRPCAGRFRAARLSDQQAPAARGGFRLSRRPQAGDAGPQRLRRVQAARQCLRHGRPRHALPRPGDPCRLRRALPGLRPRLLRLLRADGDAERAVAERPACRTRHGRHARSGASTAPSTPTPSRSARRRNAMARKTKTIKVDYLARVEGEGALQGRGPRRRGAHRRNSRSSSRRASSRRSCAAAPSSRRPTSPRGSAASARSPIR